MHRNRSLTLAVAVALGLVAAGCGDETPVGDAAPTTRPAASGGARETVTVNLVDYAFEGLPATVPAGARLAVENSSAQELHELVAIPLPDDEARSAAELAALPAEELRELLAAGPATVLLAAPGEQQIAAVGDGTLTDPGRYLVLCAIPTGADPQAYLDAVEQSQGGPPQGEFGGPPHFTAGMVADLTVN